MAGSEREKAHDSLIPAGSARLYAREIGRGPPIVIVHGGPSFDHRYLLPEMDLLADTFRLVYYDQRGRGASSPVPNPEELTVDTELDDLERVREHFRLESTSLLGHSFGAVLALEYALRLPRRVARLILVNPAPASAADWDLVLQAQRAKLGPEFDRLESIAQSRAYAEGDPQAETDFMRIWFGPGVARPVDLEKLLRRARAGVTPSQLLSSRAIGDHLFEQTLQKANYDLVERLGRLAVPTLVIYGDHEFIPENAIDPIVRAIPHARKVTLVDCGHFPSLEQPGPFHAVVSGFLREGGSA